MTRESRPYTKAEMLDGAFEARCELPDGRRFLWSGTEGLCVYPWEAARWFDDPGRLPEGEWYPTESGRQQMAAIADGGEGVAAAPV